MLVDGDTDGGCFCNAAGCDGVGEGIRAVEVFVGCVFQGACIGINDFNGAIGALGDVCDGGSAIKGIVGEDVVGESGVLIEREGIGGDVISAVNG